MSGAIPWETLQEQFFENSIYQDEIKHLIVSPEDVSVRSPQSVLCHSSFFKISLENILIFFFNTVMVLRDGAQRSC